MNDTSKYDSGEIIPNVQRITKIGGIIRNASLDELPQLFNVLKGDMSIVGPRPLLEHYIPLYNAFQKQRHAIKPGITGWAQINGRNSISWEEKFELDVWYVNHVSFKTDVKILLKTVNKVIKPEGITQNEKNTMTRFTGTPY